MCSLDCLHCLGHVLIQCLRTKPGETDENPDGLYHPFLKKFWEWWKANDEAAEQAFACMGPTCKYSYKRANEYRAWWLLFLYQHIRNEQIEQQMLEGKKKCKRRLVKDESGDEHFERKKAALIQSGLQFGKGFVTTVPDKYWKNNKKVVYTKRNRNDNNINNNNNNSNT